jgi:hypothetical protein
MLAWLRRFIVSVGIGGVSYALMLGIMVLSVVYDQELEPVITFAFDTGRLLTDWLDSLVSGTYWGQIAVNHLRERVNMTHVVLSIPAILIAAIVGIPLNRFLGGTRSRLQRICYCPSERAGNGRACGGTFYLQRSCARDLRRAFALCRLDLAASLNALSARGDTIPGAIKLTNIARQGFSGHHYVIMALCSVVASFLVNPLFALATNLRET